MNDVMYSFGSFFILRNGKVAIDTGMGVFEVTNKVSILITKDKKFVAVKDGEVVNSVEGLWYCGNLSVMLNKEGYPTSLVHLSARILEAEF